MKKQDGEFPSQPIASEQARGAALMKGVPSRLPTPQFLHLKSQAVVRDSWAEDSQVLGWWSNGSQQLVSETAVRLTPACISRWLGYQQAREGWNTEEVQRRWERASAALGGREVILVQLSAFPKMPFHGVGDYQKPRLEDFERIKAVIGGQPATITELSRVQSRRRDALENWPWWLESPLAQAVGSELEVLPAPPIPVGDFHRRWLWIEAPNRVNGRTTLSIASPNKIRSAKF